MAGSIVQFVEASGSAAATSLSLSFTGTTGNQYYVVACSDDATTTYADTLGNTITERTSVIEAAIPRRMHLATGTIATGGATTVTVTFGASVANRQLIVIEVAGVSAYDAAGSQTDTGSNPTTAATATNTAQPAFGVAVCLDYQGGTPTVGTGYTSGGTITGGGLLAGLIEYSNPSYTTTGVQSANFGNAGFNRTCTVFGIFTETPAPVPPVITTQPKTQQLLEGRDATFTVAATFTGSSPSYQWKDDGVNVGTSSPTYTKAGVAIADNGSQITVVATDSNGSTTSSVAYLYVLRVQATASADRSPQSTTHDYSPGGWFGLQAGTTPAGMFDRYMILPVSVSTGPTGTFASTLGGVTMASSGSVLDAGAFASTLAGVTMAASGAVAVNATGTFSSTLAGVTLASTGVVLDPGAFASVLAGITMAASGQVTDVGTFASTLAGATMASAGTVDNRGTFASTLDGVTMAASGSVAGAGISGSFASTLADTTMASSGQIALPGLFASTLGGVSMTAAGISGDPATGTFASTLGGVSMGASGFVGTPPVSTGNFVQRKRQPRHVIALP